MATKQQKTPADRLGGINQGRKDARARKQLADATLANLQGGTTGGSDWNWPGQLGPRPASRALAIRQARRAGEDAARALEDLDEEKAALNKEQRRQEAR